MGEVEFVDVNHCITTEDDFEFVNKDLWNQQRKEDSSLTGIHTTQRWHLNRTHLEKRYDWRDSTKRKITSPTETDSRKRDPLKLFFGHDKWHQIGKKNCTPQIVARKITTSLDCIISPSANSTTQRKKVKKVNYEGL